MTMPQAHEWPWGLTFCMNCAQVKANPVCWLIAQVSTVNPVLLCLPALRLRLSFSPCRNCLPWPRVSSFLTTSSSDPLFRHRLASLSVLLPISPTPPYQLKRSAVQLSSGGGLRELKCGSFFIALTQNEFNDRVFQNSWIHEFSHSGSGNCFRTVSTGTALHMCTR